MPLTFAEDRHRYTLDGRAVPNVTTILRTVAKPALDRWRVRVVAERAAELFTESTAERRNALPWDRPPLPTETEIVATLTAAPDDRMRVAADRGRTLHELASRVVQGETVDPEDDDQRAMVEGYVRWLDASAFQPAFVETMVFNRAAWYAGRLDVLGALDGAVWLLDVKTSSGVYGDTALQVAAYANAERIVTADGTEVDVPEVDRIGVLHVTPSGTNLYELGPVADAWREFQAARVLYDAQRRWSRLIDVPEPVGGARP